MDVVELTTLGAKIMEIGSKLKELRAERDEISKDITVLEKEILPLVTQHAKIIAEVIGVPIQPPASTSHTPHTPPHLLTEPNGDVTRRVLAYLEDAEPGVSAADVAAALRLDPLVVRAAMATMARAGR
jgi:hypothetical protein